MTKTHALTAEELAWASSRVANIIGATAEDSTPLAEFLAGIEDANELQDQLLDMLGESPLALDFASELISKRFPSDNTPPVTNVTPQKNLKQSDTSKGHAQPSGSGGSSRKDKALGGNDTETEPVQMSRTQQKKEKKKQKMREEEERKKKKQLAKRKRVRCECQASEHPLLTNCLSCGRVICEREGPGPCMFCGNDVESPDQQLQQHMRQLLRRAQESNPDKESGKGPKEGKKPEKSKQPTRGMLYSMKAGGGTGTQEAELLWATPEEKEKMKNDAEKADKQNSNLDPKTELSEDEYLKLAFKVLNIDSEKGDPVEMREAEAWVKATRRKERLLNYDRTAAQRTKLIDQSADFDPYAVGKWMSPEEKIEAEQRRKVQLEREQAREDRLRRGMRVLRLNFDSNEVEMAREDSPPSSPEFPTRPFAESTHSWKQSPASASKKTQTEPNGGAFSGNPLLDNTMKPKFILPQDRKSALKGKGQRSSGQIEAEGTLPDTSLELKRQNLRVQTYDTDAIY